MLSMVFALLFMFFLPLLTSFIPTVPYMLEFSLTIGLGVFLGGLDILTCDKHDSALPRGGIVLIGGLSVGMVAGWYGGPLASILILVLAGPTGVIWRLAFE